MSLFPKPAALRRLSAAGTLIALFASACGTGTEEALTPEGSPPAATPVAGGPISFEELPLRCEELTDIVTELRGEPPQEVTTDLPREPSQVIGRGWVYETAECRYLYSEEGDDRVALGVDRGEDGQPLHPEARNSVFDMLAADAEVPGLGDEAVYIARGVMGAGAAVHVLAGEAVYRIRVAVPDELADAAFLAQDSLVTAARAFLGKMA